MVAGYSCCLWPMVAGCSFVVCGQFVGGCILCGLQPMVAGYSLVVCGHWWLVAALLSAPNVGWLQSLSWPTADVCHNNATIIFIYAWFSQHKKYKITVNYTFWSFSLLMLRRALRLAQAMIMHFTGLVSSNRTLHYDISGVNI